MTDVATTQSPSELPVSAILIGERTRKDAGSVLQLMRSIGAVGLLHPVVVNSRHELIAGFRRLTAVKKLGWKTIPVRVVETLDDAEQEAAKRRQAESGGDRGNQYTGGKKSGGCGNVSTTATDDETAEKQGDHRSGNISLTDAENSESGQTRDKVGEALGISGKTYEQAKKVVTFGVPEVITLMDNKMLSVSDAAKVADLPKPQQKEIATSADPKATALMASTPGSYWTTWRNWKRK